MSLSSAVVQRRQQPACPARWEVNPMMRFVLALALTIAGAGVCAAQSATIPANWPARPLRFVVPLPAGSAADVVARLIGQRLGERLGPPGVIRQPRGAGGVHRTRVG